MPKNLLVVENNPIEREGLAAVLRHEGYGVVCAVNGREALERLKGTPTPDLMLLDLKMPRLNGFDVLTWLRRQPGLKRLLVTVLTSSDQPDDINRAYDLGANSYLLKPHSSSDLSELVAQVKRYWFDLNQCPVALTE